MKNVLIIGGGPAALLLAAQLDNQQYNVTLCEKKKTVGRKFLVAGEGGLNLTYNSSTEELIAQYVPSEFMASALRAFSNADLMHWLATLGVPTYVGSSNRVFPVAELKPIEVLNKIEARLLAKGVAFLTNTTWLGWDTAGRLLFDNQVDTEPDIVVFALGGASWKVTGSDGTWREVFEQRGINVKPFRGVNCAFGVAWDADFIAIHEGKPLKNIALTFGKHAAKGELVISNFGLEGNAIYALSQKLQDRLFTHENVVLHLDLKPTLTATQIKTKLARSKHAKLTELLKRELKLDRTAVGLLKQFTDKNTFADLDLLAEAIKAVPVVIYTADELDKAISTLGGIALDELDEHFQLKKLPNTYAIGEMLDWYAPTGGYLLQGCFSMGVALGRYLNGR